MLTFNTIQFNTNLHSAHGRMRIGGAAWQWTSEQCYVDLLAGENSAVFKRDLKKTSEWTIRSRRPGSTEFHTEQRSLICVI